MNEKEKILDLDRLWKLMANKLAVEATEEELKELLVLQAKYPDTTYSLQVLEDLWKPAQSVKNEDHGDLFTRHLFRMAEKNAEKAQALSAQNFSVQHLPSQNPSSPSTDRFKNYFRTIRRALIRNKGFSLINILGLAMASAFLIILWILTFR